ncbi:hypothetical protein ACO0QE_004413 [Hanseniaspora vineae]
MNQHGSQGNQSATGTSTGVRFFNRLLSRQKDKYVPLESGDNSGNTNAQKNLNGMGIINEIHNENASNDYDYNYNYDYEHGYDKDMVNDGEDNEVQDDGEGEDDDVIFIKEVPATNNLKNTGSDSTNSTYGVSKYPNYITNTKKRKVSVTEQPMFKKNTLNQLKSHRANKGNAYDMFQNGTLNNNSHNNNNISFPNNDIQKYSNRYQEELSEEEEEEEGEVEGNTDTDLSEEEYDDSNDDNDDEVNFEMFQDVIEDDKFRTDADGYYIFEPNKYIYNKRYITQKMLGGGTFSKVILVYDTKEHKQKAIKIIKSIDRYRMAAKNEIKVLNALSTSITRDLSFNAGKSMSQYRKSSDYPILQLLDHFDIKNHICLVTDSFPCSVYDFMSSNATPSFPGSQLQHMGKQLIESIVILHSLGIIHTDLKPENMLLESIDCGAEYQLSLQECHLLSSRRIKASGNGKRKILSNTNVKLIDFGSAVFAHEFHPNIISTRHYRAPEVILGYKWSFPCDIWSIGCVLYELCTGETLFPIHDNEKHLIMIQKLLNENIQLDPKLVIQNGSLSANGNNINNITNSITSNSTGSRWNGLGKTDLSSAQMLKNINSNTKEVIHMFDSQNDYKFDWQMFNNGGGANTGNIGKITKTKLKTGSKQRKSLYQTDLQQVLMTCDRLDKLLTMKLKKKLPWLELVNFEMNIVDNWAYIQSQYPEIRNNSFTETTCKATLTTTSDKSSYTTNDGSSIEQLSFDVFKFWYLFIDLLRVMLAVDPLKRWSAKQLLEHPWFSCVSLDEGTISRDKYMAMHQQNVLKSTTPTENILSKTTTHDTQKTITANNNNNIHNDTINSDNSLLAQQHHHRLSSGTGPSTAGSNTRQKNYTKYSSSGSSGSSMESNTGNTNYTSKPFSSASGTANRPGMNVSVLQALQASAGQATLQNVDQRHISNESESTTNLTNRLNNLKTTF